MEELVTDLSLDSKELLFVKLWNSNKTIARLTAGCVEKVRVDGEHDAVFGATFPAAAELPRVDVFVISRPDLDFAIPTSFTHSFSPFRIFLSCLPRFTML